jgi:hypothetical protein
MLTVRVTSVTGRDGCHSLTHWQVHQAREGLPRGRTHDLVTVRAAVRGVIMECPFVEIPPKWPEADGRAISVILQRFSLLNAASFQHPSSRINSNRGLDQGLQCSVAHRCAWTDRMHLLTRDGLGTSQWTLSQSGRCRQANARCV